MKYIHHVRIHCNEYLVFRMKKNEINVIYFSVHDYCCTAYYFSLKLLLLLYKKLKLKVILTLTLKLYYFLNSESSVRPRTSGYELILHENQNLFSRWSWNFRGQDLGESERLESVVLLICQMLKSGVCISLH